MKVTLNKKTSTKIFNRAPINFWEPPKVEKDSTTKTSCKDHICHEVKYDPSDKECRQQIVQKVHQTFFIQNSQTMAEVHGRP
jgi:hypothetical protein